MDFGKLYQFIANSVSLVTHDMATNGKLGEIGETGETYPHKHIVDKELYDYSYYFYFRFVYWHIV